MLLKAAVPVVLVMMSDRCQEVATVNCLLQATLFLLTSNIPCLLTGTDITKTMFEIFSMNLM